jgi:hypothetical protein
VQGDGTTYRNGLALEQATLGGIPRKAIAEANELSVAAELIEGSLGVRKKASAAAGRAPLSNV